MTQHVLRFFAIALISFLTLVDLFATQAILPSLAVSYGVSPAVIGSAVNAATFGMAIAGIAVAYFNRRLPRQAGVSLCLLLLAIPTALLALMPDLGLFTALRVVQGLFMSAAFSLTIAYLAENCSGEEAAAALAAYVTGNVASNLFGRLMSAAVADHLGLASNFAVFAALNVMGAGLAFLTLRQTRPMAKSPTAASFDWAGLFRRGELSASFAIGFLILFAFIGTFTYVNFELTRVIGLSPMQLGFVYLVFIPSMILTPFAGAAASRHGVRATILAAFAVALAGLPLLVLPSLVPVLAGLILVAAGTFFAQATATGFVSRAASGEQRGAAGGVYLAAYYTGGLAGSLVLGHVYDRLGWTAAVVVIAVAILAAALLALMLAEARPLARKSPEAA